MHRGRRRRAREHDATLAARNPFHDLVITRYDVHRQPRVLTVSGAPIFEPGGQFRGYRGTARDITCIPRPGARSRKPGIPRRALSTRSPPGAGQDEQPSVHQRQRFLLPVLPQPIEETWQTDYDFFSPQDAAYYQETDLRALRALSRRIRALLYGRRGQRWMLVRKSALTRPDGTRVVVLVLIDVTERRAAEQQPARERGAVSGADPVVQRLVMGTGCELPLHTYRRRSRRPRARAAARVTSASNSGSCPSSMRADTGAEHRALLDAHLSFRDLELACRLTTVCRRPHVPKR